MNSFLMTTCGIMLIVFIVGQAYDTSNLQTFNGITYTGTYDNGTSINVDGSSAEYTFGDQSIFLGISVNEGIMMGLTTVAILGIVIASGINLATWSLSENAQRAILNFGFYGGIWAMFSITTLTFLLVIGGSGGLGWLLFFIISLIHLIGIITLINGENN